MSTSKKNGLKKNQCISLAAVAASLALCHSSEASNNDKGYVSPKARFTSVENYVYSIDCEVKNELAGPSSSS